MSATTEVRKVSLRHYQALCGLALATIFLLQLQQNLTLLLNVLMLFLGAVCILFHARLSPLLMLFALGAGHLLEQYNQNQFFNQGALRASGRFLNLTDVLLCVAVLVYVIGQYRLNGLRFGVTPADPRHQALPPRSQDSLSATELVMLIFPVPLCALAAQLVYSLIRQNWGSPALPMMWRQLLPVAWTLIVGIALAAHAFRYWRRLQMDRATALLLLQDIVWHETRREQRRNARWIAWRKLSDES